MGMKITQQLVDLMRVAIAKGFETDQPVRVEGAGELYVLPVGVDFPPRYTLVYRLQIDGVSYNFFNRIRSDEET
jgi:hypothetical protein